MKSAVESLEKELTLSEEEYSKWYKECGWVPEYAGGWLDGFRKAVEIVKGCENDNQ